MGRRSFCVESVVVILEQVEELEILIRNSCKACPGLDVGTRLRPVGVGVQELEAEERAPTAIKTAGDLGFDLNGARRTSVRPLPGSG